MTTKQFIYKKDGQSYNVIVTFKRQKNIYFRFKNGSFYVTSPYLVRLKTISDGIDKYFNRLVNHKKKNIVHYSFAENYVFLLGEKVLISSLDNINNEDLLRNYLETMAMTVLNEEVRKYEQIMGISLPYKIKIKNTKSQFGSNSKRTHTLSFQLNIIHYSIDIIDSLVVHELAHEFERNHQQKFYEIVYKYCPNYKILQKKLKRGIHQ